MIQIAFTDVRLAHPEEEDDLLVLCREIHREQPMHTYDEERVRAMVRRALNQDNAIMAVIGKPGDLRAALLLLIDPIWWSDEFQLLELFNFVREDHRKSNYAKQLIQYAKHAAERTGLDLTIGVLANKRTEAKVKLYSRQLPKVGEFFCYSPSNPSRHVEIGK